MHTFRHSLSSTHGLSPPANTKRLHPQLGPCAPHRPRHHPRRPQDQPRLPCLPLCRWPRTAWRPRLMQENTWKCWTVALLRRWQKAPQAMR
ncbi:hypothetical protein V5799_025101 [Amblyomma americanum]|uniref:Uncharacterized protein n=1 Tax=Amblyomma americanum TaxID=6943 RepID=A0AAQ4EA85_AMBAM